MGLGRMFSEQVNVGAGVANCAGRMPTLFRRYTVAFCAQESHYCRLYLGLFIGFVGSLYLALAGFDVWCRSFESARSMYLVGLGTALGMFLLKLQARRTGMCTGLWIQARMRGGILFSGFFVGGEGFEVELDMVIAGAVSCLQSPQRRLRLVRSGMHFLPEHR